MFLVGKRACFLLLLCLVINADDSTSSVGGTSSPSVTVNDADGSLSIEIPLITPPGVAGMLPQLAVSFSAGYREHHLGDFGHVKGLSAIYRCQSTMAQNGVFRSIQYDSNDQFCLDGKQLVPKGPNGMNGTQYSTEVESFAQIISYNYAGSATEGPDYWIVKTRTGMEYQYGTSPDSRVYAFGQYSVRVWPISISLD